MGNSQKDLIKGFEKFESIAVDGQAFYVRHLRSFEKSRISDTELTIWDIGEKSKKSGKEDDGDSLKEISRIGKEYLAMKFSLYCSDEFGRRLFSDAEIKDVADICEYIRTTIIERGDELNFAKEKAQILAAKKALGGEPTSTIGTSSPATSANGTLPDSKKE